jgi:hypothetical protein
MTAEVRVLPGILMEQAGEYIKSAGKKTLDFLDLAADNTAYYTGTALNKTTKTVVSGIGSLAAKTPGLALRLGEGLSGKEKYGFTAGKEVKEDITGDDEDEDEVFSDAIDKIDGEKTANVSDEDSEEQIPWYYSAQTKNIASKEIFSPQTYGKFFILFLLALFIFSAVEFMAIPNQDDCVKSLAQKIYVAVLVMILLGTPIIIFMLMYGYYDIMFGYILALVYFLSIVLMYVKSNCSYGDFRYIKIIFLSVLCIFLFYNKFNLA